MKARQLSIVLILVLIVAVVPLSATAQAPEPQAGAATGMPEAVEGSRGSRAGSAGEGQPVAYAPAGTRVGEGFEDINLLSDRGWYFQNNSEPVGPSGWFQGLDNVFPAHDGSPTSYIAASFANTTGAGTISNWLLTPSMELPNGAVVSFWTRVPITGRDDPDRLEVRLSTEGDSTDVGSTADSVGDFTTLLLSINPDLVAGGYPEVWTQYMITLDLPATVTGRIGFRYFVTNGGPDGANSYYIGIDMLEINGMPPIACPHGRTKTTLLEEGFEGNFPPVGWSLLNNGGHCVWSNADPRARGNLTGASGRFAMADSDACGYGTTMDTELRTFPLDLSSGARALMQFKYDYYSNDGPEYAKVDISTDGINWTNLLHWETSRFGPAAKLLDLSAYLGHSTVWLRFHYRGFYAWWFEVDDVEVATCSGWHEYLPLVATRNGP